MNKEDQHTGLSKGVGFHAICVVVAIPGARHYLKRVRNEYGKHRDRAEDVQIGNVMLVRRLGHRQWSFHAAGYFGSQEISPIILIAQAPDSSCSY
jgi:hypothetical protein